MIDDIAASVARWAPLNVREVEYVDPTTILIGDGWALSMTCPWRLVRDGVVLTTWDQDDVGDVVWDLVGHSVLAASRVAGEGRRNTTFELTGGQALHVEPDSYLDPWVLQLPGETYVDP